MVTRVGTNRFTNRWGNMPHSTGELPHNTGKRAPQYRGTCPTIQGNCPTIRGNVLKEDTGDLDDAVLDSQKFPLRVEGSVAS